jgi:6-phosphofructokinase 1
VLEVFGRYAGYTALLPTMAGAADRCVIPESPFDIARLTELMVYDRGRNPSRYSVVLVSEGATFQAGDELTYTEEEIDQYGHKKLGGFGDVVAAHLKELSPRYHGGRRINVVNQRLGYLVRSGDPDALDSIVPMAFGNIALDLIIKGETGMMVAVRGGRYDKVPMDVVSGAKRIVDVAKYYSADRLRPVYGDFLGRPLTLLTTTS